MDRTTELRAFGGATAQFVDKLLGLELFIRPVKGMNSYKLDQHVMKMSEQLFRTEKTIVLQAPRSEWRTDHKLISLSVALELQKRADHLGLSMTLKPSHIIFDHGGLVTEAAYEPGSINNLEWLIGVYEHAMERN